MNSRNNWVRNAFQIGTILFVATVAFQRVSSAQSKNEAGKAWEKKQRNQAAIEHAKLDFFRLLQKPNISNRVKLSLDQTLALSKLRRNYSDEFRKLPALEDVDSHTRLMIGFDEQARLLEKYCQRFRDEILNKNQESTFAKLSLHYRMSLAKAFEECLDHKVARTIGLTEEQKKQLAVKADKSRVELKKFKVDNAKEWLEKLKGELTEKQREKLNDLLGEPPVEILIDDR